MKIPKITKKDLKNIKLPQHTKGCSRYIVGGVSLDWKPAHSREVWKCTDDCPLKEETQGRLK